MELIGNNNDRMFPHEIITKYLQNLRENQPRYVIGVDGDKSSVEPCSQSYCLVKVNDRESLPEVLLAKTIVDKNAEFWEEVNNLALYFNAKIVEEI